MEYIKGIRAKDPGIGGVKLWRMYRRDFEGDDPIGRDRFVDIINEHNLKVRLKVRKPRTTDSSHGLPTYPNLVKDFIPTGPNQLWVSDITYVTIWVDHWHYIFCYLSRIERRMDVKLIHHSDRGCQYASSDYIKRLNDNHISISMTESGDPKDNAQAERINSTMKNELLKDMRFSCIDEVIPAVARAVDFYNNDRPHMSIDMMTPAEASLCEGEIKKHWISYREKAIRERQALEIPENSLPLSVVQGSPSGLRPSVNP